MIVKYSCWVFFLNNFVFYDRVVKLFMLSVGVGEEADFYAWAVWQVQDEHL